MQRAASLCQGAQPRCAPFKPASTRHVVSRTRVVIANQKSGKVWGAEEENAAQVRRLINRDRKEFLGNDGDILDKYTIEYGDGKGTAATADSTPSSSTPDISSSTPNPFGSASPASNPFGASPSSPASPFGSAGASNPFKSVVEPAGLRPDMSPDPIVKETPINLLKSITLTQIVLFCSFSLIIALMLGTFNVVLNSGAIRLAGID